MSKHITVLALLFSSFLTFSAQAQENNTVIKTAKDTIPTIVKPINSVTFEKGKEYLLGGMTVTGLKKFSEETVKIFTGLRIGQLIKLPGDKLTSAIKKLYETKQFSNV
ncbi:MAG: hypothetical protein JKZ00_00925, partial [Flavobacteriaceae bacterium]|nr:hypothetical protein [Flavobacteriaceae bacterium]